METIYDRITELLKKREKTRKDLCEATGLSYHTLTSLFQRKSETMKLDTIMRIAGYLDVTADFLITGTDVAMAIREAEAGGYEVSPNLELEIVRVMRTLSARSRTILLAKAYELQEKEAQILPPKSEGGR